VHEHQRLVDALAAGDSVRAEAIIREHVLGSIDWMRTARSQDRQGRDVDGDGTE
jgi:DNA-binding GntR family transcriptional regulator